jgi:hypothetical protein
VRALLPESLGRRVGYLLLTLPLGLFYFCVLIVGLASAVGGAFIVGIPMFVGLMFLWRALARFERRRLRALLDFAHVDSVWEGLLVLPLALPAWLLFLLAVRGLVGLNGGVARALLTASPRPGDDRARQRAAGLARASSPPPTPSAGAWSATCTTARSSAWSRCRCRSGWQGGGWTEARTCASWSSAPRRSCARRSRSCATSRAGSTPRC